MCYSYPGPRCGGHIQAELNKLKAKTPALKTAYDDSVREAAEASAAVTAILNSSERAKLASARKRVDATAKKRDALFHKYNANLIAIEAKESDFNGTKDGIAALESEIEAREKAGMKTDAQKKALEKAQRYYDSRVLKYDKLNKTVNCRKPSMKYDQDSWYHLREALRANDKKISLLYHQILLTDDEAKEKMLRDKIAVIEKNTLSVKEEIAHVKATLRRIKQGIVPDVKAAEAHLKASADSAKQIYSTYDTSDSDGAGTRWASGIESEKHRLRAEIAANNGKAQFRALFDLEGNYVPARQVEGRYGMSWGIYSKPNDPESYFESYVSESKSKDPKKQEALLAKKGYTVGLIMAPAYVDSVGQTLVAVRNVIRQKWRDTRRENIEIVTANIYAEKVEEEA